MMKPAGQYTSIGGQAVIEGVMMRSPHFIAVALRKPDQKIVIRYLSYSSVSQKFSFLKKPLLRGVFTLLESMVQGVEALSYSAHIAAEEEGQSDELSRWAIAGSLLIAFVLGMGLFVALPHFIAAMVTSSARIQLTAQSPVFHLMDGIFKIFILLVYVYCIALMKDIHRVFQYHGAEHKSIYTFEAGEELIVENARRHSTLHPRCGTSFLFFLVLISVGVFSVIFPVFHLTELSRIPLLNHVLMILVKMLLMLPVAGLAYEFIKACALRMDSPFFRVLIWPGMILQKLTTREPTDDQLEVALASLRQVLRLEKPKECLPLKGFKKQSLEINKLSELEMTQAELAEFSEN